MSPEDDRREVWYLPSPHGEGTVVFNAHPRGACALGAGCALHGPSDHWARGMPLSWRFDQSSGGKMMRLCPHGVEHYDPDDWEFRRSRGRGGENCACGCGCPCPLSGDDLPF